MNTPMPLIAPQIHDNGTPAERIKQRLSDAYDAIQHAYKTLHECTPNSRDYGYHDYAPAVRQHCDRIQRLTDVMQELEAEMDAIDAQVR